MKKIAFVFMAMIVCLSVVGCSSGNDKPQGSAIPEPTLIKKQMNTVDIYTIDTDEMVVSPLKVKAEKKTKTVAYIAGLVEQNLDEEVVIDYAKQKGDNAIVSFKKKYKPVKGCSAAVEQMILECFANSILDNVESCNNIIFRCEGKAYEGGHLSFKLNEVFASE